MAQDLDGAVLDNFWYAETVDELLAPLPIVEALCRCNSDVAFERFRRRVLHTWPSVATRVIEAATPAS